MCRGGIKENDREEDSQCLMHILYRKCMLQMMANTEVIILF